MRSRIGELEYAYDNLKISDGDLLEYYELLTEVVGYMKDRGERSVEYALTMQLESVTSTMDAREKI